MSYKLCIVFFVGNFTFGHIYAQIPIPHRPLGFVYGSGSSDAPIQFDVYMGPLCQDSKTALPTLIEVAEFYGPSTLRLRIQLFPLPFHRNSYIVAQGIHVVDGLSKQKETFNFIRFIYDNLYTFSDDTLRQQEVISLMGGIVYKFNITKDSFEQMIMNLSVDQICRTEFKHGCTRGVAETPTFMINDVKVNSALPSWTVSDWKEIIDQLLDKRSKDKELLFT